MTGAPLSMDGGWVGDLSTAVTTIVTGAAGFVGFHVAQALLARGEAVVGIDNLNAYYDVAAEASAARPAARAGRVQLPCRRYRRQGSRCSPLFDGSGATRVVHLAAQAGVRYSMQDPWAYVSSNVMGHVTVLEAARRLPRLEHLVYASSSSVYGGNTKLPFAESDRVDTPVSLYAATKRADELMSHAYWHLYGMPLTGLRFFTVYGPWGRPDMAYYSFAEAILAGRPITLYDGGRLKRDFTYIDDIVAGVLACLDRPPAPGPGAAGVQSSATTVASWCRPGGVAGGRAGPQGRGAVHAAAGGGCGRNLRRPDRRSRPGCGYAPTTPLSVGIPRFLDWFLAWTQRNG